MRLCHALSEGLVEIVDEMRFQQISSDDMLRPSMRLFDLGCISAVVWFRIECDR